MINLYVDMDGTLAKLNPTDTVDDMYKPGFFENLAPNTNVVDGLKIFKDEHPEVEITILSCILPERERAVEEKEVWLERHCPHLVRKDNLFIPCGSDKASVISDGDNYLLDDHSPNLISFEKKGHGIKLLNGINGKGVKWKGSRIAASLSPKEIADSLYKEITKVKAS